jgi:hypothetical protein
VWRTARELTNREAMERLLAVLDELVRFFKTELDHHGLAA